MKKVYVAGAYSDTNVLGVLKNIGRGQEYGRKVFEAGMAPFVPWFDKEFIFSNWDKKYTVPEFYEYSMAWLRASDAVLVVPNTPGLKDWEDSVGVLIELEQATKLGIPIFYSLKDLVKWNKVKSL